MYINLGKVNLGLGVLDWVRFTSNRSRGSDKLVPCYSAWMSLTSRKPLLEILCRGEKNGITFCG